MKLTKFSIFSMLLVLALSAGNLFVQKIAAEEVLAKHLDSIGSAKSRDSVKTRIIVSDVEFLRQKQNPIWGKSLLPHLTKRRFSESISMRLIIGSINSVMTERKFGLGIF